MNKEDRKRLDRTERDDLIYATGNLYWRSNRAVENLGHFLTTLVANANCLRHIKGSSFFCGVNVDKALNPIGQQVGEFAELVQTMNQDREALNLMTESELEHNFKRMKYILSQIYRLRRDTTSFCRVIGIPTYRMSAQSLLDYSSIRN